MLFRVSLDFFIDGFAIFLQQHAYKLLYSMSVVFGGRLTRRPHEGCYF